MTIGQAPSCTQAAGRDNSVSLQRDNLLTPTFCSVAGSATAFAKAERYSYINELVKVLMRLSRSLARCCNVISAESET